MNVSVQHNLGKQEAIQRINGFLDGLIEEGFMGTRPQNPQKAWDGNQMSFSFVVVVIPFLMEPKITGNIVVSQDQVSVTANLPSLADEEEARRILEELLTEQLS